jgi:hypothetical protein
MKKRLSARMQKLDREAGQKRQRPATRASAHAAVALWSLSAVSCRPALDAGDEPAERIIRDQ